AAANVSTAEEASRFQGESVADLLRQLAMNQTAIRRIREAWNSLAPECCEGYQAKKQFEIAAVASGVFRLLVTNKWRGTSSGDFLRQLLRKSELARFANAERILEEWSKLLEPSPGWVPKPPVESGDSVTAWLSAIKTGGDRATLDK